MENMYARFTANIESDEKSEKEPKAVFKTDGKVEFDEPIGEPVAHLPRLSDGPYQTGKTPAAVTRAGIKDSLFKIFGITLVIVIAFTIASFAISLQNLNDLKKEPMVNITNELTLPSSVIDDRIQTALANLSEKALARMKGLCKVNYNGQCFWATKTTLSMYLPALTYCHQHGAEAANIYNEEHYQKILVYLRNFLPPWTTVWLGMTRDVTKRTNYLQNGTISNYTMTWYPGYPLSHISWTQLGIHVEKDTSASHQGFFNDYRRSKRHGILCEI